MGLKLSINQAKPEYGSLSSDTKPIKEPDETTSINSDPADKDATTDPNTPPTTKQKAFAMFMYILALLTQTGSLACAQVLGGAIPIFELNTWRFFIQALAMLPVSMYRDCAFKIPRAKLPLTLVLTILYSSITVLMYTAAIYLPVGVLQAIFLSVIVVINALLSICIVEERRIELYAGAVLSVLGLQLMMQPEFMFPEGHFPPPPQTNYTPPCSLETHIFFDNTDTWIGYVLITVCGLMVSGYWYGVRHIREDVDTCTLVFWTGVVGTCLSVVLMAIFEQPVMPSSALCICLLFAYCIGLFHESAALAWCLRYISPTMCGLLKCLSTSLYLVLQYTLLKDIQPGRNNWLEIVGGVVVVGGSALGSFVGLIKQK